MNPREEARLGELEGRLGIIWIVVFVALVHSCGVAASLHLLADQVEANHPETTEP